MQFDTAGMLVQAGEAVEEIRVAAEDEGDFEKAHALEDQLYLGIIQAVAFGMPGTLKMARMALKTRNIQFNRVTA